MGWNLLGGEEVINYGTWLFNCLF